MNAAAPMLTGPLNTSWHHLAVCRDADDTLFYHPEGERDPARTQRAEQAKAICRSCPAMLLCRDDARARRETHGTWGGESEDERAAWLAGVRNQKRRERRQDAPARRPRNTDGRPCEDCGRPMVIRRSGRTRLADLEPGYVFHQAHGRCEACYRNHSRRTVELRWEITDPAMVLDELIAEAIDTGRVEEAAAAQSVRILCEPRDMDWRIDDESGHLVATTLARAVKEAVA